MLVYLIFGIILVVIPSIVPQSTFVLNESKHFKSSSKSTEESFRFEESYENILTTNQKSDDETKDFKVDSTKRFTYATSEIMTLIEPLTNTSQNGSDLLKSMDQPELTNLEFLNKAFLSKLILFRKFNQYCKFFYAIFLHFAASYRLHYCLYHMCVRQYSGRFIRVHIQAITSCPE